MKKVLLLVTITFFLTGCVNLEENSYDTIINVSLNQENIKINKKSAKGYSYYLPKGLKIIEETKNNVIFGTEKNRMYMYVDVISYYNKRKENYSQNKNAYVSMKIEKEDKFGYLEINKNENEKYLVEIMYNYAKIEVIVDECDIKEIVSYAMSILSSISYNDIILESMIGEDTLNYSEVEFNIFETRNNSDIIEYDENLDSSDEPEENVPDTDLVN